MDEIEKKLEAMKARLDRMTKAYQIYEAFERQDLAKVAMILGMTPEMCEPMTGQEILDAITVRMHDFTVEFEKGMKGVQE